MCKVEGSDAGTVVVQREPGELQDYEDGHLIGDPLRLQTHGPSTRQFEYLTDGKMHPVIKGT